MLAIHKGTNIKKTAKRKKTPEKSVTQYLQQADCVPGLLSSSWRRV